MPLTIKKSFARTDAQKQRMWAYSGGPREGLIGGLPLPPFQNLNWPKKCSKLVIWHSKLSRVCAPNPLLSTTINYKQNCEMSTK